MKSQEQIDFKIANKIISKNIDVVLNHFDVELNYTDTYLCGPCPIHGGDNKTAFNIFTSGNTHVGNWICYTHHCEKSFINNSIGFIRGLISHSKYNWSKSGDKIASFAETLALIKKLYDFSVENTSFPNKNKNILESSVFTKAVKEKQNKWSKNSVRANLTIPSSYYVSRGYTEECLNTYDVGDSNSSIGIFKDRVIVPVYDTDGKFIVGFTGRTKYEKCNLCNHYHKENSGCDGYSHSSKWCHNKGFSKKDYLYNYNFAIEHIKKTGIAILVEGPGDVWRISESGIKNSLAVFGSSLTDSQQILLESSGALYLILLFDSDDAGLKAGNNIESSLGRMFKIIKPKLPKNFKDIGEMSIDDVKNFLNPIMEKL